MSSAQKYLSAIDQLQFSKRQLSGLRIKLANLESQYTISKQNQQTMALQLSELKNQNERLQCNNLLIKKQKQNIINQYTKELENVKSAIAAKEEEMYQYRLCNEETGSNLANNLLKKQIQLEVEGRYLNDIAKLEDKNGLLKQQIEKLNRNKVIQSQKFQYKVRELEKQLAEAEEKHLEEIKQHANRLFAQSQKKSYNTEDHMLKQLRRELNEMRNLISMKQAQIQRLMDENTHLHRQKISQVQKMKQQTDKIYEELRQTKVGYQNKIQQEMLTMKTIIDKDVSQKKIATSLQTSQVNKLKNMLKDLQYEINQKNQLIKQIKTEKNSLQQDIQNLKKKISKIQNDHQQQMIIQKRNIQRKLLQQLEQQQYQSNSRNVQKYRAESNKQHYQQNFIDQKNIKNIKNVHNQINEEHNFIGRDSQRRELNDHRVHYQQINQQLNKNKKHQQYRENQELDKSQMKIASFQKQITNLQTQLKKQQKKYILLEQGYRQLQKKYNKVKGKLDQANEKVLELIRSKMTMALQASPKMSQNQNKIMFQNTANKIKRSYKGRNDPQQRDQQLMGILKHPSNNQQIKNSFEISGQKMHHSANSPFFKDARKTPISSGVNREYYQRSLSIKNKRKNMLNDLKCLNHMAEDQGQNQGQGSPKCNTHAHKMPHFHH